MKWCERVPIKGDSGMNVFGRIVDQAFLPLQVESGKIRESGSYLGRIKLLRSALRYIKKTHDPQNIQMKCYTSTYDAAEYEAPAVVFCCAGEQYILMGAVYGFE